MPCTNVPGMLLTESQAVLGFPLFWKLRVWFPKQCESGHSQNATGGGTFARSASRCSFEELWRLVCLAARHNGFCLLEYLKRTCCTGARHLKSEQGVHLHTNKCFYITHTTYNIYIYICTCIYIFGAFYIKYDI